jgi:hypothetical protein
VEDANAYNRLFCTGMISRIAGLKQDDQHQEKKGSIHFFLL